MTLPSMSPEQRQDALAKAAEARRIRAEIKAKLSMGIVSFSELLAQADDDDNIGKIKVQSLLESIQGVGKVKARRAMEEIGIPENRRMRGLGIRQRESLLQIFP